MPERPLTDEEIAYKMEISIGHPNFDMARRLCHNRFDRGISEWPNLGCPHCGRDFEYAGSFYEAEWSNWDIIICECCERRIHVEHIELPEDWDDYNQDIGIFLTLNTDPPPETEE